MVIKKTIKKSELCSSLWKSCNELCGKMDSSQYRNYVLTILFIKYISDKHADNDSEIVVPAGCSFADLFALKDDKEIGYKINQVITNLAKDNDVMKCITGIVDFNDENNLGKGKEMQDRLSRLLSIFNDLDFNNNRAQGDDFFGDAYEYLMHHFDTESGKEQYYTPTEISHIMAKIIGINKDTRQDQTVYDPTCGSGSLLLKVADEAPNGISIYGQEKDVTTTALAIMNMILHDNPTAEIAEGGSSTLSNPAFVSSDSELKTFDFVVSNPSFSIKSWQSDFSKDENKNTVIDPYGRFDYGVPSSTNIDYAFFLHIIHSLKSTGKGAVILPYDCLYRGNTEATIRKNVVKCGYIKGIIRLPENLFYGTNISACIIVLDKEETASRDDIFMVDASKCFIKDGNKNHLRSRDIHKIVDVFNNELEIKGFSRLVPMSEISDPENDYNLNLQHYIDSDLYYDIDSDNEVDNHDLEAYLKGVVPKRDVDKLQRYWDVFTDTREKLFQQSESPDYLIAHVPSDKIKTTILNSDEYKKYISKIEVALTDWKEKHKEYLKSLEKGCKPKNVIREISEDLLKTFSAIPLIDKYDVYQHLMHHWSEIIQDDLYQISSKGWEDAVQIHRADLIPLTFLGQYYYARDKCAIDELKDQCAALVQEIKELIEEHSGEEGLLEDAKNDKGKITKTSLKNRMKKIKDNDDFEGEMTILKRAHKLPKLMIQKSELTSKIKALQMELDEKAKHHYDKLDVEGIKELVVMNKWLGKISTDVTTEVRSMVQILASRVKEIKERYGQSLPELTKQVAGYAERVETHLKKIGLN